MAIREEIEEVIDKSYSLDNLKKLYRDYLNYLDKDNNLAKLDLKDISFSQQKIQKKELVKLLTDVYTDNEKFKELLTHLPNDVLKIFNTFVWEGGKYRVEELEKDLELKMVVTNSSGVKYINASYLFFNFEKVNNYNTPTSYDYKVSFPSILRDIIRDNFTAPEGYNFRATEEINPTDYIQENNSSIIKYVQLYYNYVNGGNIVFSKQDKASKVSMKNMKEYCEIKEFFQSEDKDLEFAKTELIIQYLKDLSINNKENTLDLLKDIIFKFVDPKNNYSLDNLLPHLRGKGDIKQTEEYKARNLEVRKSIFFLLKELPQNEWISVENIEKFVSYRNLFFNLFDESFAESNLYFDEMKRTSSSYTFGQKTYIKDDVYRDTVVNPLIKGAMFLFSSFGVIDIAYNSPVNNSYKQKNQEYLTVYDGLKYVRLNELGAFVAGFTESIEIHEEKEEVEIKLDEDRLLLTVYGGDKFINLFIESISEKISENKYRVSFASFLNNCSDKEELENRIKTFKAEISGLLPWVWTDFFNTITERVNLLNKRSEIEVFKINNKDLINIIAEDKILKNYVLKVENFHIAVKSINLPHVKKRLEEFGYLLTI